MGFLKLKLTCWIVNEEGFMGSVTVLNLIYDLQKQLCGDCTVSSEKLINHTVPCKTNLNKLDLHQLVSDSIDGKACLKF